MDEHEVFFALLMGVSFSACTETQGAGMCSMKIYYGSLIAGMTFSLLITSELFAGSVSSFVLEPAYSDPRFPGPGFSTYALRTTTDTDWVSGELIVQLASGFLNHHVSACLGIDCRVPRAVNFGDSGIFGPNPPGDRSNIGKAAADARFALQPTFVEQPKSLATGWFNTVTDDTGIFDIAMLTFSNDANGTISGRVVTNIPGVTGTTSERLEKFQIVNGAIVEIPEPSTLLLVGLGLIGLLDRRRS